MIPLGASSLALIPCPAATIAVFAWCALLPVSLSAADDPASGPSGNSEEWITSLGPAFTRTETPHFVIFSTDLPSPVSAIRLSAENAYAQIFGFAARLRLPIREPRARLRVVAFRTWSDYESFARSAGFAVSPLIPGFFDGRSNSCYLFNVGDSEVIRRAREQLAREFDRYREVYTAPPGATEAHAREEKLALMTRELQRLETLLSTTVVRHEIAHLVLANSGLESATDRQRRWMREGLAMQFETDSEVNCFRLADYLAISRGQSPLTARRLVADPTIIGPGGPSAQEAYATAWALTYYLIHERPGSFAEYLESTSGERGADGPAAVAEFEAAFGSLDASFERRWRTFMEQLRTSTTKPATGARTP